MGEKFSDKEIVKMTWWTYHHAIRGEKNLLSQRTYEDFFFFQVLIEREHCVCFTDMRCPVLVVLKKGLLGLLVSSAMIKPLDRNK